MTRATRLSVVVACIAAVLSLAAFFDAASARAQGCGPITATNGTNCRINLCLYDANGTVICNWIDGGATITIILPATFTPIGVTSSGGNKFPFAATGCTACISLPTFLPVVCCGTVCFNRTACTIKISSCASPCRV